MMSFTTLSIITAIAGAALAVGCTDSVAMVG